MTDSDAIRRIDDPDHITAYLAPLIARGEGQVPAQTLRYGEASHQLGQYRFELRDGKLGCYTIVLDGATFDIASWGDELDPVESFAGTTWRYKQQHGRHIVIISHRSIIGLRACVISAERMWVELAVNEDHAPGACRACGSTSFRLRMAASMDVEAVGERELRWDGGDIGLRNVLVTMRCKDCGTPHPAVEVGSVRGLSLNGVELSDGGIAATSTSVDELRRGLAPGPADSAEH